MYPVKLVAVLTVAVLASQPVRSLTEVASHFYSVPTSSMPTFHAHHETETILECARMCLSVGSNVVCRGFLWRDGNCSLTSEMIAEEPPGAGVPAAVVYKLASLICLAQDGFQLISPSPPEQHCVAAFPSPVKLDTAVNDCRSRGASLVHVVDIPKGRAVSDLLTAAGAGAVPGTPTSSYFWVDAHYDTVSGTWVDGKGEVVTSPAWNNGEPNGPGTELCVIVSAPNGFWHDAPCDNFVAGYACELPDAV